MIANYDASTVSIRLGDGLGGFPAVSSVGVGSGPIGVAIGDFNNDGNLDLATANYGANTISIRLGDCMGGFSGSTNVPVGNNPVTASNGVTVSGRVTTADGRGLRGKKASMQDFYGRFLSIFSPY